MPAQKRCPSSRLSLPLSSVAAVGFGCLFVGLDAATADGHLLWVVLVTRVTALALVGGGLLVDATRLRPQDARRASLAAIGVLDTSAFALFALASSEGPSAWSRC